MIQKQNLSLLGTFSAVARVRDHVHTGLGSSKPKWPTDIIPQSLRVVLWLGMLIFENPKTEFCMTAGHSSLKPVKPGLSREKLGDRG
jgi:hypothetical protein